MLIRWRFLLGVLPLILLIAGVVNIVLLHSLSSALAPELLHNNDDSPAARYRRQSRNVGSVGRHFPTPRGNGLEAITPGQQAALASREPLGTAVIFPASPGDRATTALAFVLRERGIKPDFCRQDVSRCIAKQILRRKPDLVWLKKEGKVGQIPENALAGVAAVNNLGVGWTVWSRRSLCIALYLNRKALREDPSKSSSMANWYPECYTLPLKSAQAARLRGDKEPDGGMWVLHGSSSSESSIFASGAEAAKASGAGVLQRYISPPLTLQGYKFSLLVYVVVTSLSPLRAWIYRDGHVLLASQPYSESMQGKDWREAHVTRVDTHPHKVQHIRGKNGLLQHLAASEIAVDRVWSSIEDAVGLSVLSVVSYLTAAPTLAPDNTAGGQANKATRFKLLAAHLVLDVNLNAWVVKLDPSPSLQLNSASEPLAAPAAGNGEAEGFQQQGAGVVDHATGQARLIDDEHPYTQWMFEGDVHHLSKELEQLGAQQSRLGRMRQRRSMRAQRAAAASLASAHRQRPAAAASAALRSLLSLSSAAARGHLSKKMAGASLQHPVVAPQRTATAADDSLREGEAEAGAGTEREGGGESAVEEAAGVGMSGSALLRVRKCLIDPRESVLGQTSYSSKMSEAHVKAIGEFETERLNARAAEGWLPLHPTSASVKGRLAQVKGRKMDVLLQWWLHHGRSKCFKSE